MPSVRTSGRRPTTGSDRGAVAIVVAVFIVCAMILLAFVVDRGRIFVTQAQLQNAVDAAALAGARQLCVTPANPADTPEALAVSYANANGVPTGNVFVPTPLSNGDSSYINVKANQRVNLAFGFFVDTPAVIVTTQATASRICRSSYRIVASRLVNFNGQGSRSGPIFAGECFEGSNGVFPLVTVTLPNEERTECGNTNGNGNSTNNPIRPADPTVVLERRYGAAPLSLEAKFVEAAKLVGVVGPSATTAAQVEAAIDGTANAYKGTCGSPTPQGLTDALDGDHPVHCTDTGSTNLNLPSGYTGSVIMDGTGTVTLPTGGTSAAPIDNPLVWSKRGKIVVQSGTVLSSETVLYAPYREGTPPLYNDCQGGCDNGSVTVNGNGPGGTPVNAFMIGTEITLNGGSQELSVGLDAPGAGEVTLIQ